MGHGISPVVQMPEVGQPDGVRWVGTCEIEEEAEPLEVLPNVFNSRVPGIEFEFGGKLRLDGCPEADRHCGSADLQAFRVEIAAEPLKMATDEHYVTLQ